MPEPTILFSKLFYLFRVTIYSLSILCSFLKKVIGQALNIDNLSSIAL